ncbi:MAG: hypothetical protein IJI50_09250 [Ruminococcus sp.]|nr:hypothetical protein [Ruminococcus sp.]
MNNSRNDRLQSDFREMLKIQDRPYLSWIATKGELPYAEEYLLHIKLRSYVLTAKDGEYLVGVRDRFTVKVTLWDSYPQIAPNIRMLSIPPVFHPAWYSKGTYCPMEPWSAETSLKDYILQMLRTLTFDPALMETTAPANYKALNWFEKRRENAALFPSDQTELTENSPEQLAAAEKAALTFGEIIDRWSVRVTVDKKEETT